jgi:malate permease and related proteins
MSLGLLARRLKYIDETGHKQISNILINITLPALLISTALIPFSSELLKYGIIMIFLGFIVRILFFFIGTLLSNFVSKDREIRYLFTYMMTFSNAGFVGVAICLALFGKEGALLGALFNIPHELLTWSLGIGILKKGISQKNDFNWKNMVTIPGIFSVLVIIIYVIPFHSYPEAVVSFFNYAGMPTIFLAMFLLGSQLYADKLDLSQNKKALIILFVFKLIILPASLFLVLKLIGMDSKAANAAVVISAMPPQSVAPILAAKVGINPKFASTATIVLTIIMLLTLPVILLLEHNF